MHRFDTDKDGKITLEEFVTTLIDVVVKSPTDVAPVRVTIQ